MQHWKFKLESLDQDKEIQNREQCSAVPMLRERRTREK